ncbi:hypothetical protein KBC31_04930 [Candidatus Saccharibacteria bacterium]|nr:hypothetical protein [Candidatus Saccharibacteria bacterium]
MPNPTKKQHEILEYVREFTAEHGYSPSYREIKRGLSYGSIGTVAYHVDQLVALGRIRKSDNAARSLEIIAQVAGIDAEDDSSSHDKWLIDMVDAEFRFVENKHQRTDEEVEKLRALVMSLQVFGLKGAKSAFTTRLSNLMK